MSDTRKSLSSLPRKLGRLAALAGLLIGFGAVAGFTAASAAPLSGVALAAPGLQSEAVGYKRALKRQQFYSDYYVTDFYAAGPSTRVYRRHPGRQQRDPRAAEAVPRDQLAAQHALLKAERTSSFRREFSAFCRLPP